MLGPPPKGDKVQPEDELDWYQGVTLMLSVGHSLHDILEKDDGYGWDEIIGYVRAAYWLRNTNQADMLATTLLATSAGFSGDDALFKKIKEQLNMLANGHKNVA